jgi:hypothetical protein
MGWGHCVEKTDSLLSPQRKKPRAPGALSRVAQRRSGAELALDRVRTSTTIFLGESWSVTAVNQGASLHGAIPLRYLCIGVGPEAQDDGLVGPGQARQAGHQPGQEAC